MAGYDDTKQKILQSLMQRPNDTEIQPENHQDFALSLLDYIRSVELISASTLIGIANPDTVPVQSNDANEVYIAAVAQELSVVFENFRDENGLPLTVTTESEGKIVILLWNKQYWSKQEIVTNVVSESENAYFSYNLTIRKQYSSVSAMNSDKVSPVANDGKNIKYGEIVSVRNPSNSSEDAVYSYELDASGNPTWVLQMKLSALATRMIDGGSASVKLDTIQSRRDTKANWEARNPVLAEGELGLVLDDKNSYKVGDGISKWNDLPYRGYNGNIVNELGDNENSVISQKGITDILQYIIGADNKIDIADNDWSTLDNAISAGFYILTRSGHPAYHMLVTWDNSIAPCTINQWVFGNIVIDNGTISGTHIDGTFNIVCRTYSIQHTLNDPIPIVSRSWNKWRYLQSFFLVDKDGKTGNETQTLGKDAIENKISALQNDISDLVSELEQTFKEITDGLQEDYDYLSEQYRRLVEWVGYLEELINTNFAPLKSCLKILEYNENPTDSGNYLKKDSEGDVVCLLRYDGTDITYIEPIQGEEYLVNGLYYIYNGIIFVPLGYEERTFTGGDSLTDDFAGIIDGNDSTSNIIMKKIDCFGSRKNF